MNRFYKNFLKSYNKSVLATTVTVNFDHYISHDIMKLVAD